MCGGSLGVNTLQMLLAISERELQFNDKLTFGTHFGADTDF